jgi:hypothetical protein
MAWRRSSVEAVPAAALPLISSAARYRRVDELLLDARPLARVACPGHIGELLDVKTLDPALAFRQLGLRLR